MQSNKEKHKSIDIYGAREHNLKNINLSLSRNSFIVFTGVSGSGKSSLAFETIYSEAQRRYMETFSSYASNFLGGVKRPDVDKIDGLSPAIAIEQKTTSKNPKSTVGTVTDIYDFLRLLYSKVSTKSNGEENSVNNVASESEFFDLVKKLYLGEEISIFANIVDYRKGIHKEIFQNLKKANFTKVKVDGKLKNLNEDIHINKFQYHTIDAFVGIIKVLDKNYEELKNMLSIAWKYCNETISIIKNIKNKKYFKKKKLIKGVEYYPEPSSNIFSFNSPQGACEKCQGLGVIPYADIDKLIPNKEIGIARGAIIFLGQYREVNIFQNIECILKEYDCDLLTPVKLIPKDALDKILYGGEYLTTVKLEQDDEYDYEKYLFDDIDEGVSQVKKFSGLINFLRKRKTISNNKDEEEELELQIVCTQCDGKKLKNDSLLFTIDNKSIADVSEMNLDSLQNWILSLENIFTTKQKTIAKDILKEINKRLSLLLEMGLSYLQLSRASSTLSGGENQRVRLSTQIGTELLGVLYILDEPSIGLHPRDNEKLIFALKKLRDLGNTIIVVEHDKELMLNSDYIVDIGPGAGINGGRIIACGPPIEFLKQETTTAKFLSGKTKVIENINRIAVSGEKIKITDCTENNLKNVTLEIPLGVLTCITGVSGSGKSTLINNTFVPALKNILYRHKYKVGKYKSIEGIENISDIVEIDQNPIGRTPKSCLATYTGLFGLIRNLYTQLPESKIRGYLPGRFSFNVKGGRCDDCEGAGLKAISINFMEDVYVTCTTCSGKRYNRSTIEIKYKGKSIADILEMTVDMALDFFEKHPQILKKIKTLQRIGLGYMTLGQHATTISGGEAQRLKLSTELCKRGQAKTLYVLDEPTTGLHFSDIKKLLDVINTLIEKGNSVVVIEHNMDVICAADYIIDLGPDSGPNGGEIIAKGAPEEIAKVEKSITGKFIKMEL